MQSTMNERVAENVINAVMPQGSQGRKRKGEDVHSSKNKVKVIEDKNDAENDDKENDLSELSKEEICCDFMFESSSSLRNRKCFKNPEHSPFTPIDQFSFEKLPDPYKDPLFDELVKHLSKLVVRINVKLTSKKRPDLFQLGKRLSGSGKICFSQSQRGQHSHFKDKREWGTIRITTVAHVLFDDSEVKHTTVDLFYDGENSKFTTLPCYKLENSSVKNDRAVFICITDDMEIIKKLRRAIEEYRNLHDILYNKYKGMENNNLVICVSHPHGCDKHVSFGSYVKKENLGKAIRPGHSYTRYHYDVPTCASSSGAPMFIISKQNSWTHHPHSGAGDSYGMSAAEWEKNSS